MNRPKRHHWWPQLHSRFWTNPKGVISVTRKDGSTFAANPQNIAVMSELYTKTDADGNPNVEVEEWFSREIERPFLPVLERIISLPGRTTEPAPNNPEKREMVKRLGFVLRKHVDYIQITDEENRILARYVAALLARTPKYLSKIDDHHQQVFPQNAAFGPFDRDALVTQANLNHMQNTISLYDEVIAQSDLIFIKPDCDREFLYCDTGIVADEPWSDHGVPFDIHVPLTPELSVEVLPAPSKSFVGKFPLALMNSQGVARMNRIVVGNADRFVFSRSAPPIKFIQKNFGIPAPKDIATKVVNGRVEALYDPSRGH